MNVHCEDIAIMWDMVCARRWVGRLGNEFYTQGAEEARLGLPVSPFMDAARPRVAELQCTFIGHVVLPICHALHSAALLPGAAAAGVDCVSPTTATLTSASAKVIATVATNAACPVAQTNGHRDKDKERDKAAVTPTNETADEADCPMLHALLENLSLWRDLLPDTDARCN